MHACFMCNLTWFVIQTLVSKIHENTLFDCDFLKNLDSNCNLVASILVLKFSDILVQRYLKFRCYFLPLNFMKEKKSYFQ